MYDPQDMPWQRQCLMAATQCAAAGSGLVEVAAQDFGQAVSVRREDGR